MPETTIEFEKGEVNKLVLVGIDKLHPALLKNAGITNPDVTSLGSGRISIAQKTKGKK